MKQSEACTFPKQREDWDFMRNDYVINIEGSDLYKTMIYNNTI